MKKLREAAILDFINMIRAVPIFPLEEIDPEKLYSLKPITYGPRKAEELRKPEEPEIQK